MYTYLCTNLSYVNMLPLFANLLQAVSAVDILELGGQYEKE